MWECYKEIIQNKWKQYWFNTHPSDIAEYSWTYLFTGGKEIRARLFCELWKYLSPDCEITAELAFAIECIHVASIVLDDTPWMDNATERRGRQTLHTVFSPKKAVLIAHDVILMAVEIWKQNKPSHIDEINWKSLLVTKLQRLTTGQWLDLEKKGNLIELASLKTGVLFELVTETVALCIGLDRTFWKIWGNDLGILFQWTDDWLDREEDIVQKNRNAFNESFETTLRNYLYLWQKIEKNVGQQWFNRPFGIFMKKYFIEQLNINSNITIHKSLNDIHIPYPDNLIIPDIVDIKSGKYSFLNNFVSDLTKENIVKKIYQMSENVFELSITEQNLWNIDENEWQQYCK